MHSRLFFFWNFVRHSSEKLGRSYLLCIGRYLLFVRFQKSGKQFKMLTPVVASLRRSLTTSRPANAVPFSRSFNTTPPSCQQRNFMSTQPMHAPEEDSHFLLILGPPGGGKGTISKKLLAVSIEDFCEIYRFVYRIVANWIFFEPFLIFTFTMTRTFLNSITFLLETF